MDTLNVAAADEKKSMQSLLKSMEFLGTVKSSDEAYSMINGNADSDVVLVYVKRASGDTEPLDDTYMQKKSLDWCSGSYKGISVSENCDSDVRGGYGDA
mgnify:CR=1 FL=1